MRPSIWEGVAESVWRATGSPEPPQDAFKLAECCGLRTRPWGRGWAVLEGDLIRYPARVRPTRQHGLVAHEVAHWALDWAEESQSEQAARWVGGALMLPREPFNADLAETRWDLEALQSKHLNCSAELIARRIVQLRDAVATVLDQGRVRARVASPWLGDRFRRLSRWERELADRALETEQTQRPEELVWAVPVIDGPHRRVVLVAEAEQLSLRL